MFRLYHSNDLDVLKEIMVRIMATEPPQPFENELILVQSQGMAHWLKLNIADALGVAAQIDFPLPSSFIWRIFNQLRPDLPQRSHFDKQAMTWKLMRVLPSEEPTDPDFSSLYEYFHNDHKGIKRYQLASTIADVFDQYLVYRPDWIEQWEQGDDAIKGANVELYPWQPKLWRLLLDDSKRYNHNLDHRARLLNQLEDMVKTNPAGLSHLPKRIFVFGIAALPSAYWKVLKAISTQIEVHYCLMNPSQNFWGDIISERQKLRIIQSHPERAELLDKGNPLLASWGRLGQHFLTMVHDEIDHGSPVDSIDNAMSNVGHSTNTQNPQYHFSDIDAYVEPSENKTMLNLIKADIYHLIDQQQYAYTSEGLLNSQFKRVIDRADDSLRIVVAHNPIREVQRLHDQLLSWLSNDSALEPRDILIMVPDIDQYAPYFDAVFSSVDSTTRIPWAVADQSIKAENPLIDAYCTLLNIPDQRLVLTDVMDWLELEAIQRKFGISENELPQLRDWLQKAHVCWGLNEQHRASFDIPLFSNNSWSKGLRQLLLGFTLSDEQISTQSLNHDYYQNDIAISAVEGIDSELLGKLILFVDCLDFWRKWLSQPHDYHEWESGLINLLNAFFDPDEYEESVLNKINNAISQWSESVADANYDALIEPAVVRTIINDKLQQQGGWAKFIAGSVNICTLMPMRSIPFKVICLLGMNDADYPRQVTPIGFDLIANGDKRRGDRSRRDDDRYLFLEAVCSAQQKLYISYRGFDACDNTEKQPSVLVSELLDYVCDTCCLDEHIDLPSRESHELFSQWLIEECTLQPFSKESYIQSDHLNTFLTETNKRNKGELQLKQNRPTSYHKLWHKVANIDNKNEENQLFMTHNGQGTYEHDIASAEAFTDIVYSEFCAEPLDIATDFYQQSISANDVLSVLENSSQFFIENVLGTEVSIRLNQETESEPFTLDGLTAFKLRSDLIASLIIHITKYGEENNNCNNKEDRFKTRPFLEGGDETFENIDIDIDIEQSTESYVRSLQSIVHQYKNRIEKSGILPVSEFGHLAASRVEESVQAIIDALTEQCRGRKMTQFSRSFEDWHGIIESMDETEHTIALINDMDRKGNLYRLQCADELIHIFPGRLKANVLLRVWWFAVLDSLTHRSNAQLSTHVLIALPPTDSYWAKNSLTNESDKTATMQISRPSSEVALQWVADAVRCYWECFKQPNSHIPELVLQLLLLDESKHASAIRTYVTGDYSDINCVEIDKTFADFNGQIQEEKIAEQWLLHWKPLWQPIIDHLKPTTERKNGIDH